MSVPWLVLPTANMHLLPYKEPNITCYRTEEDAGGQGVGHTVPNEEK